MTFLEFLLELIRILMFLMGAGVLDEFWKVCTCPVGVMFKICWHLLSYKASRTPSKINDISSVLAGVDDAFDVPHWGWCPWWRFEWSPHVLRESCLKFGWNLLRLKTSRIPSKINGICTFLAVVDFEVPDCSWCPWWHFGWSAHALRGLCLKFCWNLLSVNLRHFQSSCQSWWWFWCSWQGLGSLMTFWMVSACPDGAMFQFCLESVEFKSIRNPFKDPWHL